MAIINGKTSMDHLIGFGFEHGIKVENDCNEKAFHFQLPQAAKQYVSEQSETSVLEICIFGWIFGTYFLCPNDAKDTK